MSRARCDYCYRWAIARIYLRQGWVRTILHLPPRTRDVCANHIHRASRG